MAESFTQTVEGVWKNNKPFAIAVLVFIGAVLFILYKRSQASVIAPSSVATTAPTAPIGPGGTFTNTYETTTINNPPPSPTPVPYPPPPPPPRKGQPGPVQTIFPAPKGSLKPPQGAGNGDTNWYPYIIQPGETMGSLTQKINWGNNIAQLAHYRNNAAIFAQMGVNTSNPNTRLVPGWSISV